MSDATPLPRNGEVFFDDRGEERALRLSWHPDASVMVLSIWNAGVCSGTFRLMARDVPTLMETLSAAVPDSRPRGRRHAAPDDQGQYDSYAEQGGYEEGYEGSYDQGYYDDQGTYAGTYDQGTYAGQGAYAEQSGYEGSYDQGYYDEREPYAAHYQEHGQHQAAQHQSAQHQSAQHGQYADHDYYADQGGYAASTDGYGGYEETYQTQEDHYRQPAAHAFAATGQYEVPGGQRQATTGQHPVATSGQHPVATSGQYQVATSGQYQVATSGQYAPAIDPRDPLDVGDLPQQQPRHPRAYPRTGEYRSP